MRPHATSNRLLWVRGDVGDRNTWEQVRELAEAELPGPPTVLVCCAARVAVGDILSLDQDAWTTVFRATFWGAVLGMQSCLPIMIQAGGGSIVTVGSVSGLYAEQGLVAYGAAKAALYSADKVRSGRFWAPGHKSELRLSRDHRYPAVQTTSGDIR